MDVPSTIIAKSNTAKSNTNLEKSWLPPGYTRKEQDSSPPHLYKEPISSKEKKPNESPVMQKESFSEIVEEEPQQPQQPLQPQQQQQQQQQEETMADEKKIDETKEDGEEIKKIEQQPEEASIVQETIAENTKIEEAKEDGGELKKLEQKQEEQIQIEETKDNSNITLKEKIIIKFIYHIIKKCNLKDKEKYSEKLSEIIKNNYITPISSDKSKEERNVEGQGEGKREKEREREGKGEREREGNREGKGERERERDSERQRERASESEREKEGEGKGEREREGNREGKGEGEREGNREGKGERERERDSERQRERASESEREKEGEGKGEREREGNREGKGEREREGNGEGKGEREREREKEGEGIINFNQRSKNISGGAMFDMFKKKTIEGTVSGVPNDSYEDASFTGSTNNDEETTSKGGNFFNFFKNNKISSENSKKEEDAVTNSFYINDDEFSDLFLLINKRFEDETNKTIISLISQIKDIIKKGNNAENCENIINYLFEILEILKSTKTTETTENRETNTLEKNDGSFGLKDGPLLQYGNNNIKPIDLTNITKNLEKIVIYIYDVILGIIILICIIISIIHIFNILKFLYKCFIEIGSVQHSNVLTKDTFRYKLLEYITYIDNSSLPGLINTYNNPTTGTEQIIKFSNIIKDFYGSSNTPGITQAPPNPTEESIAETTIKTLGEDKLTEIKNNHATLVEENNKKEGNTEMKNWDDLSYIEKLQYINEHEPNCAKFINENYNNAKEPIFNIFLCIRLIFICFKFFITFIMILVISVILYIVTQIVDSQNSSSTDMFNDKTFIQILKASGICFIYLIINIILYKTMFLKIYNKMLDTYLNVICIDILLNQIKKDMTHEHTDTPTHTHPEFFNDDFY